MANLVMAPILQSYLKCLRFALGREKVERWGEAVQAGQEALKISLCPLAFGFVSTNEAMVAQSERAGSAG